MSQFRCKSIIWWRLELSLMVFRRSSYPLTISSWKQLLWQQLRFQQPIAPGLTISLGNSIMSTWVSRSRQIMDLWLQLSRTSTLKDSSKFLRRLRILLEEQGRTNLSQTNLVEALSQFQIWVCTVSIIFQPLSIHPKLVYWQSEELLKQLLWTQRPRTDKIHTRLHTSWMSLSVAITES